MLSERTFIESGLIELYCLGHASAAETQTIKQYAAYYPALQAEIDAIEKALNQYTLAVSPKPKLLSTDQMWNVIHEDRVYIAAPPLLGENHDWKQWKKAVKNIKFPSVEDNVYMHPLRADEKVEQFLVRLSEFIPDEHHEEIYESFLILEGACECIIGEKTIKMKAGDYIEIPLWEVHNIKVVSDTPVIAILQWLKAA